MFSLARNDSSELCENMFRYVGAIISEMCYFEQVRTIEDLLIKFDKMNTYGLLRNYTSYYADWWVKRILHVGVGSDKKCSILKSI